MRRGLRSHLSYANVISTLCLFFLLGGVALATIPSEEGILNACYAKPSGALRLVNDSPSDCAADEAGVRWNQTGPAGPPGPAGPSVAYQASQPRPGIEIHDDGLHTILTRDVPAGSYAINAKVGVFAGIPYRDRPASADAHCFLQAGSRGLEDGHMGFSAGLGGVVHEDGPYPDSAYIPLQAAVRLFAPTTLRLSCEALTTRSDQYLHLYGGELTAIRVGSIEG